MTIDLTGLVRPHLVEMTKRDDNPNAAEFRLQPLERGFGYTLGNSLRRLLLSSLRGSAVWGFRLDGVVHEHQTVQGVLEDVHQIVQRLKSLTLVLADDVDDAVLHIRREGAGPVYARDIQEHGSVVIKNPDHLLFTLQDDREVSMELYVNKGRGYVEAEMHPADRSLPVDLVRIDAIYNPVRRANFAVAETRVGQRTDYDRLTVQVETNGTITPEDAIAYAAALAQVHFQYFVDFGKVPTMRDAGAAQPRPAAATCASGSAGRSTTSVSRSARSTRSRTRTSGPSRIWSSSPRTTCSRSRTWARRRSARSPSCCSARGSTSGWASRRPTASCGSSRPGVAPMAQPSAGTGEV